MSKYFSSFCISLLIISSSAIAQKKQLTIEGSTTYSIAKRENLNKLEFRPGTNEVSYLSGNNIITLLNTKTKEKSDLDLAGILDFNKIVEGINSYSWLDKSKIIVEGEKFVLVYNTENKSAEKLISISENENNLTYNKVNGFASFTKKNNIFIKLDNANEIQITFDTDSNYVNGQTVSRNEFGINNGMFWSPNGKYLAFYRKDESQVTSYPLIDINGSIATSKPIKYPMAGTKSEHVCIGIYNLGKKSIVYIERDSISEKYLTCASWDPSDKYFYAAVLNRGQDTMKLNKYNVSDGKLIQTLFTETDNKFVEPEYPLLFLNTNKNQFIWNSKKSGHNHLYLYNTEGQCIKQLTNGSWDVISIIGTDKADNAIYYLSTQNSPLEEQIYKVSIKSLNTMQISATPGTHKGVLSENGNLLLDIYESISVPRNIDLINSDGKKVANLLTSSNPLEGYEMPILDTGSLKASDDSTKLFYRILYSKNQEAGKKYPVIVYVYGGPHNQLVKNEWLGGASLWEHYMAVHGYIMFTTDNRGTANRGKYFENVIHRQLGKVEMRDQLQGLDFIKKLPSADTSKIGIYGWSFGGFMTISLMTHNPDIFKVGVAGGPVTDWKMYEVMYGERYMDTPQENPAGYEENCLTDKTDNLKGKLLIIHGAQDATVVWQNSLKFLDACIKNDKQVDYFVYPNHQHNVRGTDRVHLNTKITQYFDNFLK